MNRSVFVLVELQFRTELAPNPLSVDRVRSTYDYNEVPRRHGQDTQAGYHSATEHIELRNK
jgi:hypothetical protein